MTTLLSGQVAFEVHFPGGGCNFTLKYPESRSFLKRLQGRLLAILESGPIAKQNPTEKPKWLSSSFLESNTAFCVANLEHAGILELYRLSTEEGQLVLNFVDHFQVKGFSASNWASAKTQVWQLIPNMQGVT